MSSVLKDEGVRAAAVGELEAQAVPRRLKALNIPSGEAVTPYGVAYLDLSRFKRDPWVEGQAPDQHEEYGQEDVSVTDLLGWHLAASDSPDDVGLLSGQRQEAQKAGYSDPGSYPPYSSASLPHGPMLVAGPMPGSTTGRQRCRRRTARGVPDPCPMQRSRGGSGGN